ncbi:MAG TPA: hypothetical protein VEF72_06755 [Mycobacterium sp.]|nr:hypothetical protein [Mycobacterium sp.]
MDSTQRHRLVTELTRLTRREFEDLVDEIRARDTTEEQFAAALGPPLQARANESPWSPLAGLLGPANTEEEA